MVAALYKSRAEAEVARERLISSARAQSPRIIGKDTAAAIDGLGLSPKDMDSYRHGISQGGHLLVAQVPSGTSAKMLVSLLKAAKGQGDEAGDVRVPDAAGVQVEIPSDEPTREPEVQRQAAVPADPAQDHAQVDAVPPEARGLTPVAPAADLPAESGTGRNSEEVRIPVVQEELAVHKQEVARGGARVRAFTREAPVEEQVELSEERVEVESRSSGVRVTPGTSEAGGLFKERTFEIAEMREVAVVTKEAFVREEIIVRKNVDTRTETISDTVRHTEVEVEDLPGSPAPTPALFGRSKKPPR
jgi:stress response protein YsnF